MKRGSDQHALSGCGWSWQAPVLRAGEVIRERAKDGDTKYRARWGLCVVSKAMYQNHER